MRKSFLRSMSYDYQYELVSMNESGDSGTETQKIALKKKARTQRLSSEPGTNMSESANNSSAASLPVSQKPVELHLDEAQPLASLADGQNEGSDDDVTISPRNDSLSCIKLAVVLLFFVVSLVLHIYTLTIFISESESRVDNTQLVTNLQDSLTGEKPKAAQVGCLLNITYTKRVKEIEDRFRGCKEVENASKAEPFPQKLKNGLSISFPCFCAKQLENKNDPSLKARYCNQCFDSDDKKYQAEIEKSLSCQNGGNRSRYPEKMHLLEENCGNCTCSKDFTGKYCHLPKKLECVRCDSCSALPPCNDTSTPPCLAYHGSQLMNCTKPDTEHSLSNCSSQMSETETKQIQIQPGETAKTEMVALNETDSVNTSCSRNAAIGYFLSDWIVFAVIIIQLIHAKFGRKCEKCKLNPRESKLKWCIIVPLMLIIIPPIVNCVTCCSRTCDTLGKLIPFIKSLTLVFTVVLLYRGIRNKPKC